VTRKPQDHAAKSPGANGLNKLKWSTVTLQEKIIYHFDFGILIKRFF